MVLPAHPNDAWDFSGNNELVLFDYKAKDGKIVKATAHADRNGFFYVVDRSNGKLQNAFPSSTTSPGPATST